jgi:hypothetical protein
MGTKHKEGERIKELLNQRNGESIASVLSSAGNWIANNSSNITNAASALGSVAGTVTGIVKNSVEIDNMRKQNEAEIQALKDKTKAEIETIRENYKTRKTKLPNTEGSGYNINSLKTNLKTKSKNDNTKSDQVVNKILGRTKRDIIDGSGFKLVTE